jgi:N-acetylmuramoyl-L-alanine amidase
MIKKVFLRGLFAAGVVWGAISLAGAAQLRALALTASANSAQVTLDFSDAAAQKIFRLEHPQRVVIDLPNTHLAQGVHAPLAAGVVTGVRFGRQPHGTLRLVLELNAALPAHAQWGAGGLGRRLTISLGEPVPAVTAAAAPVAPVSVHALHAPGEGDRDIVIAVDAGHGGFDPGAIGHGGTREKDVTLAIARALAARLNAQPGMRAVLTRDRDEYLELRDRIARARNAHADMFISVHADSIADRSVSGASVYVLSVHGASSEAARVLAERENADPAGAVQWDEAGALAPVLLDATQSEMIGVSASAAELVVGALGSVGEVRKPQVQRAGFVVLKSLAIPSMLVETAYISNPAEERRLRNPAQQARLADAIAGGVHSYFLQNPPDGTRMKQEHRSTLASAADGAAPAASP